MGRKKIKSSGVEIIPPKAGGSKKGSSPANSEKKVGASPQIIFAMGCAGAVLGFLSGLNLWPPIPAALASPIASAGWLAAILGQQHLDYITAAQGLFLGLAVGLGIPSSFNFPVRKMILTWLLAGGGLLAGALLFKSPMAAAAGWLLGLAMAWFAPAQTD